ncbi:acid-sensing ion channel 2-like [Biomphalaria glabrata]|uniref:Acid-sensing ion channel 2-like n=2 Tax=Biomphalaria glabrata TaxID=6526 RepID=A0A9W3BBE3_BIOGL|nr:acid-sensing ion channel 2-like [Biomphalaria glabrata]
MKIDVQPAEPRSTLGFKPGGEMKSTKQEPRSEKKKALVKERDATMLSVVSEFADKTSLNGILMIKTSNSFGARFFWVVVFLAAVGALTFHSYSIVVDYLSYQTTTSVQRTLDQNIQMPFITICLENPIRQSKLNETNSIIIEYIQREQAKYGNPSSESVVEYKALENIPNTTGDIVYYGLEHLSSEIRAKVGHQLEDILVYCGGTNGCGQSNITVFQNIYYGNCYTLDTTWFEINDGTQGGILLQFFLEIDEYIEEIRESIGFKIILHDPNSMPNPEFEGFQILPGTQSNIALRLLQTQYLPQPYGDCVDHSNSDYFENYDYVYTETFCMALCSARNALEKCHCKTTFYDNVDLPEGFETVDYCGDNDELYQCWKKEDNSDPPCDECQSDCSLNTYNYKISSSIWPNSKALKGYLDQVCGKMSADRCARLRNQSESELRENFVSANIFYESFYVDSFTTDPAVTLTDFLCNFGGCIGLWIGLSIISVFEVVQLVTELFLAFCRICLLSRQE